MITNQEDVHATIRMVTQDRAVNKVLFIVLKERLQTVKEIKQTTKNKTKNNLVSKMGEDENGLHSAKLVNLSIKLKFKALN